MGQRRQDELGRLVPGLAHVLVRVIIAVAIVLLFFVFFSYCLMRSKETIDEHQSGGRRSRPRIMFVVSLHAIQQQARFLSQCCGRNS